MLFIDVAPIFPGRRLRPCFYGVNHGPSKYRAMKWKLLQAANKRGEGQGVFRDGRPSIVPGTPKPDF